MSTHENFDYREWLKAEFSERCERNPLYSLRAFARDLEFQPSHLSDVLNAKQGLSPESAARVAKRLKFKKDKETIFVTSVEAVHGRSKARREAAKMKLRELQQSGSYQVLDQEVFEVVSDWHHYAILELIECDDFVPTYRWLAQRLNISESQAELAVSRLQSVGLLKTDGKRWKPAQDFRATTTDIPSAALKKFHTHILEKASRAIRTQSIEQRDFSCMTFSIALEDLPFIKAEIKKFRRGLDKKLKTRPNRTEVYAMAVQFFALTQLPPEKSNVH